MRIEFRRPFWPGPHRSPNSLIGNLISLLLFLQELSPTFAPSLAPSPAPSMKRSIAPSFTSPHETRYSQMCLTVNLRLTFLRLYFSSQFILILNHFHIYLIDVYLWINLFILQYLWQRVVMFTLYFSILRRSILVQTKDVDQESASSFDADPKDAMNIHLNSVFSANANSVGINYTVSFMMQKYGFTGIEMRQSCVQYA